MEINTEEVKNLVKEALAHQFDLYTWSNMIDDMALTDEEKAWAKEHTCYSVEEL